MVDAPRIVEFEYSFLKFQNKSKLHCEDLIGGKYLINIEKSFQEAEYLLNSFSFKLPGKTKNYSLWSDYIDNTSCIRKAKGGIDTQVHVLKRNWGEVLTDAKSRLGDLYDKSEYPDPKQLDEIFGLKINFDYEYGISTTLEIYGEYSLNHVVSSAPPTPDIFEVDAWAKELEKKQKHEKED